MHSKPPRKLSNIKKAAKLEYSIKRAARKEDHDWHHTKKGRNQDIRNYLMKLAEKIDPLECVAIGGFTYIIHEVIMETPRIAEHVAKLFMAGNPFGLLGWWWQYLPTGAKRIKLKDMTQEMFFWLISFCLAYIVVRHAGQLIGLLDKGISSVATMLLGIV